jgi:hypothetical protein
MGVRSLGMKKLILLPVLAALVLASTAVAGFLDGDPRVCIFGPQRKADCARTAAKVTTVSYMRQHATRSTAPVSARY